jgi:hypothetical protein
MRCAASFCLSSRFASQQRNPRTITIEERKRWTVRGRRVPEIQCSLVQGLVKLSTPGPLVDVSFVPEVKRLYGIVERVVSANETTSTPRKIIASSINNLTVWYGERGPISYRFHLFGCPSHRRTYHINHEYNKRNATSPLILFLSDYDSFRVWHERTNQPLLRAESVTSASAMLRLVFCLNSVIPIGNHRSNKQI